MLVDVKTFIYTEENVRLFECTLLLPNYPSVVYIVHPNPFCLSRTFSEIFKTEEQYSLCQELCTDLAHDLQKEGLKVLAF